jgi:hypothetical protein
MLEIRHGEHGPRVVLLQVLLNRTGASLAVDGVYGPKTRTAVETFQKSAPPLHRSGNVDSPTFNELFRESRLSIVDVVDVGDPMLAEREANELRAAGSQPIELGLMCNGVGQMVSDAINQAASPIALLRITGHGNLGRWMTVSVGAPAHLHGAAYAELEAEFHSYIDLSHFAQLRGTLARLQGRFARFGSMEHLGCSIGSRPSSRQLMGALSDLWAVPISAGIQTQRSVLHFDGPPYTAYPEKGSLPTWSKQFRDSSN